MERYIFEIDDALPRDFCEDVISRFECDERKQKGETITEVNEKLKKSRFGNCTIPRGMGRCNS